MTKQEFIDAVAKYVRKYARTYGILVHSPIIAQAILESGWGESSLAKTYHNYFGLKCGSKWTGASVNLTTKEEYTPGTLTTIRDNFRVYSSMEEGVKGYFEFIQLARYQNLRGITDPQKYLETIKADGYATSSTYVEKSMKLVTQYDLTKYDKEIETMAVTVGSARWGESGGYNQIPGDASGAEVSTQAFYMHDLGWVVLRAKDKTAREKLAQAMTRACSNNNIGYDMSDRMSLYNHLKGKGTWDPAAVSAPVETDCSALVRVCCLYAGINAGNFTTANQVSVLMDTGAFSKVTFTKEGDLLKGDILVTKTQGHTVIVISGTTGTGEAPAQSTASSGIPSKTPKFVGKVTASLLNVRTWAGTEYPNIKSYPLLAKDNLVDVCDTVRAKNGKDWYYVRIGGKTYGFVSSAYIKRV